MLYNPLTRNLDLTPYYAVINFRTKTVLLFSLTVLTLTHGKPEARACD